MQSSDEPVYSDERWRCDGVCADGRSANKERARAPTFFCSVAASSAPPPPPPTRRASCVGALDPSPRSSLGRKPPDTHEEAKPLHTRSTSPLHYSLAQPLQP